MKTRAYPCTIENCNNSFRDEESLLKHLSLHEGKPHDNSKDFICHICNKCLSTKQSLKEHEFVHLRKKNFRCSEIGCGRLFKQNSQLCNHRKVHKLAKKVVEGKKKFQKKFKTNDDGVNHYDDEIIPECFLDDKNQIILPPIQESFEDFIASNLPNLDKYT